MEALKNLISNVPDWLRKLDELNGQIEQRQIELAQLAEAPSKPPAEGGGAPGPARSVRNKGSTESLKLRDEPEGAHPRPEGETDNTAAAVAAPTPAPAPAAAAPAAGAEEPAPSSPADSQTPSALQRQASQVRAAGQARARATLRKRQRTDSVVSAEGAAPKYRTRSMIIVYYDSYVQNFFEGLVKFVSASRNMMRKARMAAKVAQIKRLAELEMPDDDDEEEEEKEKEKEKKGDDDRGPEDKAAAAPGTAPAASSKEAPAGNGTIEAAPEPAPAPKLEPALQYRSTRQMGRGPAAMMMAARTGRPTYMRAYHRGVAGAGGGPAAAAAAAGDVYDELDKGLEYVQSMCEHAAHQFLRDGDCADEVANIQRRLAETKELADREMDRIRREEPEALQAAAAAGDDETRARSYRPQSMRKDAAAAKPAEVVKVEVDEPVAEAEEPQPRLAYKSTRMMT